MMAMGNRTTASHQSKVAPPKAAPPEKKVAPKAAPSRAAKQPAAMEPDLNVNDQFKPSPRPGIQPPEPGHPPLHRIPIVDHKGNVRGHVGHSATQATVARFLGRHGAKLGTHQGRTAWIGDVPPPPPPPDFLMGPNGPMVNPHGGGTDKPPFPPDPEPGKGGPAASKSKAGKGPPGK